MWKWTRRILLGLLSALVLSALAVLLWSSILINRGFQAEERRLLLSSRPDVLAKGERLARVFGCFDGCHGVDMEGNVFAETPLGDRIIAPNLTQAWERFSTSELEAIVRQGVKPDGKSVLAMPSSGFAVISDNDLSAVFSFIQAYEKQDLDLGRSRYGLLARSLIVAGVFQLEAAHAKAQPWSGQRLDPGRLGEYLAIINCAECHGPDFQGSDDFAPSLAVVKAYDEAQFERLLREGVAVGDRELSLMKTVAEKRFAYLTPEEVSALYYFLQTRF